MTFLLICSVALFASGLTFFSGFGLGTLLTPVFALFFPIDLAVGMTAVVHLLNNFFKLVLVGKYAHKSIVWQFGTPSVFGAILGAFLLKEWANRDILGTWSVGNFQFDITVLKIVMGVLFIFFALWEIIPALAKLTFDEKYLIWGGVLSGFFGGLSGMQGALRSAFLSKLNLKKEVFIGTGCAIACIIDVSRLSVYAEKWRVGQSDFDWYLVGAATLAAFVGAYFGNRMLKKTTIESVQKLVAVSLILFGVLMISGIL